MGEMAGEYVITEPKPEREPQLGYLLRNMPTATHTGMESLVTLPKATNYGYTKVDLLHLFIHISIHFKIEFKELRCTEYRGALYCFPTSHGLWDRVHIPGGLGQYLLAAFFPQFSPPIKKRTSVEATA